MKFYNPIAAIRAFFQRRKLIYLGSTELRYWGYSPLLDRSWESTETVHYYASEAGKRVVKGISKKDFAKYCGANKDLTRWYYDKDCDPLALIPQMPSKFCEEQIRQQQLKKAA